ncbi:MAG TPA: replication protein [Spirochaetota bacterium]|nr:replication protein [Spirochaetota bacterium]
MALIENNILHFTKIPNNFIDEWLLKLSGTATKVFLVILRKTIGWHKESDVISISQIEKYSGLSENSVLAGLKELKLFNLIETTKEGRGKATRIEYKIKFSLSENTHQTTPETNKQVSNTSNSEVKNSNITPKNEANTENNTAKFEETKEIQIQKKEEERKSSSSASFENKNTGKDKSLSNDYMAKLISLGISQRQSEQIITQFDFEYIDVKIRQLNYLLEHSPHKVNGKGRFLYNSIINNWQFDEYFLHLAKIRKEQESKEKERLREIELEKNRVGDIEKQKAIEEQEEAIEKQCHDYYNSIPKKKQFEIQEQIKKEMSNPFFNISKEFYEAAYRVKFKDVVKEYIREMSFEKKSSTK